MHKFRFKEGSKLVYCQSHKLIFFNRRLCEASLWSVLLTVFLNSSLSTVISEFWEDDILYAFGNSVTKNAYLRGFLSRKDLYEHYFQDFFLMLKLMYSFF